MILKSIEIQGFKSFADKTVLRFGQGITAVVGPNGSGKSNISDAVRWVLGEQSTKNLRGQSMEDVIFGGTNERRPHGFAEVTLTIDNTDRTLDFDNDSVSVTRRYFRSHESEYLINKAVVRLKDVNELFMDTGLGRDGYSMIGQGKIDTIVSSKSNERRDIFEEACGISRYRYRKIEAERRLTQADDNLVRLKDITSELESRVGPLGEQSRKAQRFLEYSETKKELEIGLWLHNLDDSNEALRAQEHKITIANASYKDAEDGLLDIAAKIEQSSEEYTKATAIIDDVRRESATLEEAITRTGGEIAVLYNTISHNNESIERITNDIRDLEQSDEKTKSEIDDRRAQIKVKEQELTLLQEKVHDAEQELNNLISDSESISRKIEDLTKTLNVLSAGSSEQRVTMVTAQSSVTEIESRSSTVSELIVSTSAEKEKHAAEFDDLNKYLSEMENTIEECTNSLKGYQLRYNSRSEKTAELKLKLDSCYLDVEEKKRRVKILQDLERNMEGFNYSVKAVMKDAEQGLLRGVHGPVSRIIEVSKEYATAVEIALGAAMQNIVVDTENDAKRAIEFLKSGNKGRATFLPITAIHGRSLDEKGLDNCFGFVGIASDLLKTDSKYSGIIKSLLGRTVVSQDIDCAVTMAKKYGYRFKIVTLDGQVINAGGSLTGGSLSKNAGILSRAGDIATFNEEIEKLNAKSTLMTEQYNTAMSEFKAVEADILSAKSALTVAQEDKIRTLGEIKRVGELKSSAEKSFKELTVEKEVLTSRAAELSAIVSASLLEISLLDEQKSKAQTEIDSISGGRDSVSGKREELSAEITSLKLKMMETGKDIQSLAESANMLEQSINSSVDRTGLMMQSVTDFEAKNNDIMSQISTLKEQIELKRIQIHETEQRIIELSNSRDSADKNGQELRRLEREKTSDREKLSGEVARLEERKETMLREYDEIIRRLFDEYELTRSEAEKIGVKIESITEARKNLAEIKGKIRNLGNVNVSAIEEYKEVSERY
ncbi:MAG: chromosome segregation protein SMC, partial [Oscillospiraceae bacterium]|nr:chromosome segregation protein SMC [Oscillospiraceae bacterium]